MSELQYEKKDEKYYFKGIINEYCDFIKFFKGKPESIIINMKEVRRINSTGVRRWTEALYHYPKLKVTLEECPREVIDQCNMVPEFMGSHHNQVHVTSFYAHYYNEDTDEEDIILLNEHTHYKFGEGLIQEPEVKAGMELDDLPEKYFGFLTYGN